MFELIDNDNFNIQLAFKTKESYKNLIRVYRGVALPGWVQ